MQSTVQRSAVGLSVDVCLVAVGSTCLLQLDRLMSPSKREDLSILARFPLTHSLSVLDYTSSSLRRQVRTQTASVPALTYADTVQFVVTSPATFCL